MGSLDAYSFTEALADGWLRVYLTATTLTDLPLSHDDIGINLHIGTLSAHASALVMVLDNIVAGAAPTPPGSAVPLPSTLALASAALLGLAHRRRAARS